MKKLKEKAAKKVADDEDNEINIKSIGKAKTRKLKDESDDEESNDDIGDQIAKRKFKKVKRSKTKK
jgi:hypothetical protein